MLKKKEKFVSKKEYAEKKAKERLEGGEKGDKKSDPAKDFIAGLKKDGSYMELKKIETISTGSLVLNRIIGNGALNNEPGGFPRGGVTELFGDESTGKTTFGLLATKNAMDAGGVVVWADFEHTLQFQQKYMENLGINPKSPLFIGITPMNFETGVKAIGEALVIYKPALVVIDSVTAMMPRVATDSGADEELQIGKHAKLTGSFLNWVTKRLDKTNTALLLINQTRVDIAISSMPGRRNAGPKQISSGGNAPRFFTTVRIQLKQTGLKETVTDKSLFTGLDEKKAVSQVVKAICVKNKFDIAYKSGPIYMGCGKGVDNIMSLVYLGENTKVFKVKSPWIEWTDPNGKHNLPKLQGRMAVVRYLEDHPEVLNAMTPYLIPTANSEAMMSRKEELEAMDASELSSEDKEELARLREQLKNKIIDSDDNVEVEIPEDAKEDMAELNALLSDSDDK
jgi:recombination protein RecA